MTGESLPVTMRKGDKAPMGCCVKSGEVEAIVRVQGKHTELDKIISTIANTNEVGHFEVIIYSDYPLSPRYVPYLGVVHHGADVDAQVLSYAERGIRCLGIASSDADGK